MEKSDKKQLIIALLLGIGTLAITASTAGAKLALLTVSELAKFSASTLITVIPQLPIKKATLVLLSVPIYVLRRLWRLGNLAFKQMIASIYIRRTGRMIEDDIKREFDPPNDDKGNNQPINQQIKTNIWLANFFHILGVSSITLVATASAFSYYISKVRELLELVDPELGGSPLSIARSVGNIDVINQEIENIENPQFASNDDEKEDLEEIVEEMKKLENEGGDADVIPDEVVVNNSPSDDPPPPPQGGMGRPIRADIREMDNQLIINILNDGSLLISDLNRLELDNLRDRQLIGIEQYEQELRQRGEDIPQRQPEEQPEEPIGQIIIPPIPQPLENLPVGDEFQGEIIIQPDEIPQGGAEEQKFLGQDELRELRTFLQRLRNEEIDQDLERRLEALRENQENIENLQFIPELNQEVELLLDNYDDARQEVIVRLNEIEDEKEDEPENVVVNEAERPPPTPPAEYKEHSYRRGDRLEIEYKERLLKIGGDEQKKPKRLFLVFNRGSSFQFVVPSSINIFNEPELNLNLRQLLIDENARLKQIMDYFRTQDRLARKEALKNKIFEEFVELINHFLTQREESINNLGQQNIRSAREFFKDLIERLNKFLIKLMRQTLLEGDLTEQQIENILKLTPEERAKLFKIRRRKLVREASAQGVEALRRLLLCRDEEGNVINAGALADGVANVAGVVGAGLLLASSRASSRNLLSDECFAVDFFEYEDNIEFNEDVDNNYDILSTFINNPLRGQPAFLGERNFINGAGDHIYEIQYDENNFNSRLLFFMGGRIVDISIEGVVKALPMTTHLANNINFMRNYAREWLEAIKTAFPNYHFNFADIRNNLVIDVKFKVLKELRSREISIITQEPNTPTLENYKNLFENRIRKKIKNSILRSTNFLYNEDTKILTNQNAVIIPQLQIQKKSGFQNFLDIIRILP